MNLSSTRKFALLLCAVSFGNFGTKNIGVEGKFFSFFTQPAPVEPDTPAPTETKKPTGAPTLKQFESDDYFSPDSTPVATVPKKPTPYSNQYTPYVPPPPSPHAQPTERPTPRPTLRPTPDPTPGSSSFSSTNHTLTNYTSTNSTEYPSKSDPYYPAQSDPYYPVYPVPAPVTTPTPEPTLRPTLRPTPDPTPRPTFTTFPPTKNPTPDPTPLPTRRPTPFPTHTPTKKPTPQPTFAPTPIPTSPPTATPTSFPTATPTAVPTPVPTARPSPRPTPRPTEEPTDSPTVSQEPSEDPTGSEEPSESPTSTDEPSEMPSESPSFSSFPTGTPVLFSLAEIICDPQNNDLFNVLCNIITQLPDLERFLNGNARRQLEESRGLAAGSSTFTVFAPTDKAFGRVNLDIEVDLLSTNFTSEEKSYLKRTIQYHIIGNNSVKTFVDLECNSKLQTMNSDRIQVRCFTNARQILNKFMVGERSMAFGAADADFILSTFDAKIISRDVEASNGILHVVNNVLVPTP